MDAGMSIKAIAKAAPCSRMTVHRILGRGCGGCSKTRRLRPDVASRLLAVASPRPVVADGYKWTQADETVGVLPEEFVGSLRNLAWQRRGNCADPAVPTRVFFPGRGDQESLEAARAICTDCPVRQRCLEYGLATNSSGIWGGLSELERQQLRGERGGVTSQKNPAPA
jgi:WhiB family redox-sensing transcriptional regulator